MENKFNQKEYINNYMKENYKKIHTAIKKEDAERLESLLKKHSMNKAEFIRWAIDKLNKEGK